MNLRLDPESKRLFIQTANQGRRNLKTLAKFEFAKSDLQILDEQRHFHIIAEWEYYALLALIETKDFKSERSWIAKRLKITELRLQTILMNLEEVEFIIIKDSIISLNTKRIETTQDISSVALLKSHEESLEMAKEKLTTVDISKRYFGSETLAIDVNKISEVKSLIEEFKSKLSLCMEKESKNEVYHLGFNLFPLTHTVNQIGEHK